MQLRIFNALFFWFFRLPKALSAFWGQDTAKSFCNLMFLVPKGHCVLCWTCVFRGVKSLQSGMLQQLWILDMTGSRMSFVFLGGNQGEASVSLRDSRMWMSALGKWASWVVFLKAESEMGILRARFIEGRRRGGASYTWILPASHLSWIPNKDLGSEVYLRVSLALRQAGWAYAMRSQSLYTRPSMFGEEETCYYLWRREGHLGTLTSISRDILRSKF